MEPESLQATLGEFRCPNESRSTAGTLEVVDGRIDLELLGCLESDLLPPETTGTGYPRPLRANDPHSIVSGILRTGEPVTLLQVTGNSWGPPNTYNGRTWRRSSDLFSGDRVTMRAAHAIMRTAEDSEPEFDQITFSLPQLATLLSRQAIWQPTEELDEVGGLTPWIVPRISDFSFEYENYRIGFNQLIQVGMEIKGTEAARTDFSLERADGKPIAVLGCVDLLNDLRLLAEFVNLGHVPMGAMSGWRRLDGRDFREEFPILSWIQASRGLLTARQLKLGIHHLYPNKRTHFISNLSDDISAEDPQRSELICNWLDWIKEPCNRGAVISYLAPFHRENSLPNEMFRWTYEVLQDLCDKPQANSRVAPVDDDEVNRRNETIGLIESALDSHEEAGAADWAIERLRTGSDKKGQARKLSELIEPLEQSLERSLRSRRQDRNLETIESSKKTAKALTKLRGDLSHGTSSESSEDFGWRLDQIHLIVWSLILSEMGYPAALIDKLMFARSYRENWWQGR